MQPARVPDTDSGFEGRLIPGIRPIAELFLATGLHHLFDSGVYDRLADAPGATDVTGLAAELSLDRERLAGFLRYLGNEDVVVLTGPLGGERVELGQLAHQYAEFRSWYTFLVGGYQGTVAQIGDALRLGSPPCTREGKYVGVGSCEIARWDGLAMTRTLLDEAGMSPATILDLGCGDATYLASLCEAVPGVRGWGVEPDPESCAEGRRLLKERGLSERVTLVNASAEDFLADPPPECRPDTAVFGYVLQELLGQYGEDMVAGLLTSLAGRFPGIAIAVIEVDDQSANPTVMRHGLARNFWNLYYLVHVFTRQRLESQAFWEALFDRCGLSAVATRTTPAEVDTTGVELGYLLTTAGERS